jgi:hypothetical protein
VHLVFGDALAPSRSSNTAKLSFDTGLVPDDFEQVFGDAKLALRYGCYLGFARQMAVVGGSLRSLICICLRITGALLVLPLGST